MFSNQKKEIAHFLMIRTFSRMSKLNVFKSSIFKFDISKKETVSKYLIVNRLS